MPNEEPLLASVSDPDCGCSVLFEDNGHVAYAYPLAADGEIIEDVWLYNIAKHRQSLHSTKEKRCHSRIRANSCVRI